MATEKDLKYALKKLVLAIDGYTDAVNTYPLTERNFEHLQKISPPRRCTTNSSVTC